LKPRYDSFRHFDFLFSEFDDCSYLLNVKTCVASTSELVVNLEDPNINVQVLSNQLG
jgi:hypothetical protein